LSPKDVKALLQVCRNGRNKACHFEEKVLIRKWEAFSRDWETLCTYCNAPNAASSISSIRYATQIELQAAEAHSGDIYLPSRNFTTMLFNILYEEASSPAADTRQAGVGAPQPHQASTSQPQASTSSQQPAGGVKRPRKKQGGGKKKMKNNNKKDAE
jgi:hypothetical protein